jgi:cyclopropane fatty-acyl-phospholipid synthase-like methyltransferase
MELVRPYTPYVEPAQNASPPEPKREKLRWTTFAGSFLGRALSPGHLVKAARLQKSRKAHRHTYDDAQLALYSQILPSDFLHYGYFDDPTRRPEDISLSDVTRAQTRYAELLLELAGDPAEPVLDIGCGMGGLCRMLEARGFAPTALTPDRLQASHVKSTLSKVPVIRCKFEDLPPEEHRGKFGTVITSESLQYLKLPRALPILQTILKPGGRWIGCDYFHSVPSEDRSCHVWDDFVSQATDAGWRITFQREITPHILPTLAFIHMWATRFGIPLMQFAFLRLRRKQPAVHHLAGGVLELLEKLAEKNISLIDPTQFAAGKQYMLFALERA